MLCVSVFQDFEFVIKTQTDPFGTTYTVSNPAASLQWEAILIAFPDLFHTKQQFYNWAIKNVKEFKEKFKTVAVSTVFRHRDSLIANIRASTSSVTRRLPTYKRKPKSYYMNQKRIRQSVADYRKAVQRHKLDTAAGMILF